MVYHIGIWPTKGEFAAYNESCKETLYFNINDVNPHAADETIIDGMFKKIKIKINEKNIGCICIYLETYFYCIDEIRKLFLKKGNENGFINIQLINGDSLRYLCYILPTKYKPEVGDNIWLLCMEKCFIWVKTNTKAKFVETIDLFSTETHELKIESEISQDPNLIIYNSNEINNFQLKNFEITFPKCKFFSYESHGFLDVIDAALIKARIMANDLDVLQYNFDPYISFEVKVKINTEIIINIEEFQSLPLEKSKILTIKDNQTILKVSTYFLENTFYEEIMITPEMMKMGEILLEFKVSENCIFSIICLPNYTIKNIERLYKDLYFDESNYIKQQFHDVPKNILNKNLNTNIVGIDLGTSRCFAAVNRQNGIETMALDNGGERQLPSYVGFDEIEPKCGKEVVRRLQNYSKSTVFDSKRIIGRSFENVRIDLNWPFNVTIVENKLVIRVQSNDGVIEKYPEDVAATLLKHIKQKVDEFQGKILEEVVITVPAVFTPNQKLATHVAAILAGWKIIHLLAEPIAAAIAHFVDRPIPPNFTLLLFDMGGGTIDICIFKIANGKLQIETCHGDENLGGRDFDQLLFTYFASKLEGQHKIKINENDKLKYRLMEKCMEIKHYLSTYEETSLDVSEFNIKIDAFMNITRMYFEKLASSLLGRIRNIIIKTLSNANYFSRNINKILLVGGGCRMPMVQKLMQEMFKDAEYSCDEHPDEIVAIGAAYYASYLNSQNSNTNCSII